MVGGAVILDILKTFENTFLDEVLILKHHKNTQEVHKINSLTTLENFMTNLWNRKIRLNNKQIWNIYMKYVWNILVRLINKNIMNEGPKLFTKGVYKGMMI